MNTANDREDTFVYLASTTSPSAPASNILLPRHNGHQ